MINKRIPVTLLLLLISLLSASSIAGVNSKSGNFYISYSDFSISDDLDLIRTYNSKSTYSGLFGYGWNSALESFLIVSPDGYPVYYAYGGGSKKFFEPSDSKDERDDSVNVHIETLANLIVTSDSSKDFSSMKEKLLQDRGTRLAYWKKFLAEGKVSPIEIEIGSRFENYCACNFDKSTLVRTLDGYTLSGDKEILQFSSAGVLESISTHNGKHKVTLHRDSTEQRIRKITYDKVSYFVFYNDQGQISGILDATKNLWARYQYKNKDLIYSKDSGDNVYKYEYDKNHNLPRIQLRSA